MAATAAEIPRERDLLTRLAAGTAGVVGAAFLRRLVAELAAALDAEVAFVAELSERPPRLRAHDRQRLRRASSCARATCSRSPARPCEHAYEHDAAARPPRRPPALSRTTASCARTSSTATWRSRCATPTAARSATSA